MTNRTRKIVLRVPVTPEERELIRQKMALLHTRNFSAYARKMLIDGYVVHIDTTDIRAQTAELQKIGVNVNQIARRLNSMENEQRQSRIASSPAAKRFQLSGFIGGILLFVVRCGGGCNIQRTAAQEGRELVRLHVHAAHQLNDLQVFLFSLCSFQFFQLLLVFRDFFFEPFNIALNARKSFCHTKSFLASR